MPQPRASTQKLLFPEHELAQVTVYEQPLNERVRCFLRLEYLFLSVAESMQGETPRTARNAIAGMIDISDQLSRTDVKGELIKELERHVATIGALRDNPGVNPEVLEHTLARLEPLVAGLKSNACQPGAKLRQNDLVTQIRQRLAIPGGLCSFDLPAFHHWLSRDHQRRSALLNEWMADLRAIENAVAITLKMIRESARPQPYTAVGGFYQQTLEANSACHLVRVSVADEDEVFAEISGGKHRFAVRFMRNAELGARPQQSIDPIDFELQCCAL